MRDGALYGAMFGAGLLTAIVAGSMMGELGGPLGSGPATQPGVPSAAGRDRTERPAAKPESIVAAPPAPANRSVADAPAGVRVTHAPLHRAAAPPASPVSTTRIMGDLPATAAPSGRASTHDRARHALAVPAAARPVDPLRIAPSSPLRNLIDRPAARALFNAAASPVPSDRAVAEAASSEPARTVLPERPVAAAKAGAAPKQAPAEEPVAAAPDRAAPPVVASDQATMVAPVERHTTRLAAVDTGNPAPAPPSSRLDRRERSVKSAPKPRRMASVQADHVPPGLGAKPRVRRDRMGTRGRPGSQVSVIYGTDPGFASGPVLIRIHRSGARGYHGPVRTSRIPLY